MSLAEYLSPARVYRELLRRPVAEFLRAQAEGYRRRGAAGLRGAREALLRAAVVAVFVSAILWLSVFMYVVFYYTYMPNVTHVRPVHLQFKACEEAAGACSFPAAHVQLARRGRVLMAAQPYRARLVLDMPESPVNKELGMFMVCAQLRAAGGALVSASCRAAMLRHRSRLHTLLRTVMLAPLLLAGFNEEKQQLSVELFSDFEDDEDLPVTDAYVELQSRFAQVYSCELQIEAHFSGLRYVMYNWPRVSAAVGISTNLFFVSLIFILSWYHLQDGLPDFIKSKFSMDSPADEELKEEPGFTGKVKLEKEDSSSTFFDDDNFLEELQLVPKEENTMTE
ncbi:unnamed protein product [Plutella xylostella]|uniref:Seipin n=1 Tax=Plutella xylostella TaxID=51655 RepID=A0A8S4ED15_PLUXY|nr:unnamed protein product [Plutella xylostella]